MGKGRFDSPLMLRKTINHYYGDFTNRTNFTISPGQVHLWFFATDHFYGRLGKLKSNLSRSESERADSFLCDTTRWRYLVIRGLLREIIGNYLHLPPAAIVFESGPFGKPHIIVGQNSSHMHFNLSYSNSKALVGISCQEIGVDIEKMAGLNNLAAMVTTYFTLREQKAFHLISREDRFSFFYSHWVRKEAFLKAQGIGLGDHISKAEVLPCDWKKRHSGETFGRSRFLGQRCTKGMVWKKKWLVEEIEVFSGYKSAFCVENDICELSLNELAGTSSGRVLAQDGFQTGRQHVVFVDG